MKATLELSARVLENPFAGPPGAWHACAERFLKLYKNRDQARLGEEDAWHLALAQIIADAAVGDGTSRNRTSRYRASDRVRSHRGVARTDVERLTAAALRCYRALDALAGESASLRQVQAAAWSASFGVSLSVTLRLERVIREHDILIAGETGTGKDAVAHAIASGTLSKPGAKEAPFAALNVAAIPETLIESELFGHVRGAFTGAGKNRVGHIRSVASGCLFLDEVGDLPPTAQSKLLRVMETDRVTPLGSDATYDADVRYIAATHKDLRQMVERGTFREDLYERLAGNVIRLPPLRERPEDIAPIGLKFAARYLAPDAPEWRRTKSFLSSAEALSHRWPGNVRELQNCLRNVMLGLEPGLLPTIPRSDLEPEAIPVSVREVSATLRSVEDWYLARVLDKTAHNHAQAARILGVDRTTVTRRARALG